MGCLGGATGPNRYRLESIYYTNRPRRVVVNCGDDSAASSGDMRSDLFQAERLAAVNAFALTGRAPAPPANARELFQKGMVSLERAAVVPPPTAQITYHTSLADVS